MHLKDHIDCLAFLRAVAQCQQDVIFSTQEGDILNLKSELSKYVFAVVLQNAELRKHATVQCKNTEDLALIQTFLTAT